MSTSTLITSRDPKGLHAVSLFEASYNKSGLNDARAQMLNEHGGEFQDGIQKLIRELTTPNQYANEEVKSNFTYPKEYKGHKPIAEQIMAIGLKLDLDPYHAMEYAKKRLGGSILDAARKNANPAVIRDEVQSTVQALAAAGFAPGTESAMHLF